MHVTAKTIQAEKGYPLLLGANRWNEGYNFAVEVPEGIPASVLLYRKHSAKPVQEIAFEEKHRLGRVCSMKIKGISPADYEYNYKIDGKVTQDPFTYSIRGRERFGAAMEEDEHKIRCGLLTEEAYDWEQDAPADVPYEDMILYKLHVRGYTKLNNRVKKKGTFAALQEMIPYWKELGINAIELMPAYEFMEVTPAQKEEAMISRRQETMHVNYWGYIPGYYFAPKRSYCATKEPEKEFRDLVKALHQAGIACIMEFYFPDNTNLFTVLRALQFWKIYYHVDGFHVLGQGAFLDAIMQDGVLAGTKIMVGNYDLDGFYQGKTIAKRCLAQYDPGFCYDMRRLLKSDEGMVEKAICAVKRNSGNHGVINYITSHDGFTLNDLVSYNYKHNEANGEENQDGSSYNYSWNCGVEGPTRKQVVRQIRERQMRNAFFMLLLSQGIPMLYAGDEMGNSQDGNNNAWCQDNETGWTDWKGMKKNENLVRFVKEAIAFRKAHPILHMPKELKGTDYEAKGYPDISFHGERAWYVSQDNTSRLFGAMYCGKAGEFIYVAYNFHWENRQAALPNLPEGMTWVKTADTGEMKEGSCFMENGPALKKTVEVGPRTIVVLVGQQEARQQEVEK